MAIGIDFGTTNSVLAYTSPQGVTVQSHQLKEKTTSNFSSVIFFPEEISRGMPFSYVGPEAMDAYFEHEACG